MQQKKKLSCFSWERQLVLSDTKGQSDSAAYSDLFTTVILFLSSFCYAKEILKKNLSATRMLMKKNIKKYFLIIFS